MKQPLTENLAYGIPMDQHAMIVDALKEAHLRSNKTALAQREAALAFAKSREKYKECELQIASGTALNNTMMKQNAVLREGNHALEKRATIAEAKLETYQTCMCIPHSLKRKYPGKDGHRHPDSANTSFGPLEESD